MQNLTHKKRIENNLCIYCGGDKDDDSLQACASCRTIHNNRNNNRHRKLVKNGICRQCSKSDDLVNTNLCIICWVKRISWKATGSVKNWKILMQMLDGQNYKCAYSGIILIPGQNASIDHKTPPSVGGSKNVDNLHWVDLKINRMKSNRTHEDFLSLLQDILIYNGYKVV